MNKFFEFLKELFGLTDEQIEKAQEELSKEEMGTKPEGEKKDEKGEKANADKGIVENVGTQPAGVNEDNKGDADMGVSLEEYKKLQDELAAVKGILEKNNADAAAEKRMNKIKSYKDCLDPSYLSTLLDGVDEKDFDSKVEEIKKEKAYLFSKPETDGFNPAEPNNKLTGVEAAFFKQNTDLKPQL